MDKTGIKMKELVQKYGLEILRDNKKLNALLADLFPREKKLRNAIRDALDAGAGRMFFELAKSTGNDATEKLAAIQKKLVDEAWLSDAAAENICKIFLAAIGREELLTAAESTWESKETKEQPPKGQPPADGADVEVSMDITFEESVRGMEKKIECLLWEACEICYGTGIKHKLKCSRCHGTGYTIKPKLIMVTIPAGVSDGQRIRIKGKGEPGKNGGVAGSLLIKLHVVQDPAFRREGNDIYSIKTISKEFALSGGELMIRTAFGDTPCYLKPGAQTGQKICLKGKGAPTLGNPNVRGNHYAELMVLN